MNTKVLVNKRKDEDNWEMDYSCHCCDNYVSQVIEISFAFLQGSMPLTRICKSCLSKMISELDKNMIKNLKQRRIDSKQKTVVDGYNIKLKNGSTIIFKGCSEIEIKGMENNILYDGKE